MDETRSVANAKTTQTGIAIRRGVHEDVVACHALDHSYTTRHVWQIAVREESEGRQVRFQQLRLPRPLEAENLLTPTQLAQATQPPQQLWVAEERMTGAARILGYLTLTHETCAALTRITQLVVTRTRRGEGIGGRLLAAAEASIAEGAGTQSRNHRIRFEIQSTNYPATRFCQHLGYVFSGYDEHHFADGEIALYFFRASSEREG